MKLRNKRVQCMCESGAKLYMNPSVKQFSIDTSGSIINNVIRMSSSYEDVNYNKQ